MSVLIVYIFCLYCFIKSGKGSLARLFLAIFIASLSGYILLFDMGGFQLIDIFHALWICLTIAAIVMPWKGFKNIKEITVKNNKRVDTLGTLLIVLCIVLSISCGILAYFVLTMVQDINAFKYVNGASEFYYSLGIDMKGFILTTLLYPIGYLLVPYVFYYLSQGRKTKAFFSFLGSALPVFYGLTYFSRAHMTHFVMVYVAAYFLLHNVLSKSQTKKVKIAMIVLGAGVIIGFSAISTSRFEDRDYNSEAREISVKNQSSTVVSTIDYFSQWWPNSQEMFRRYNGSTMGNSIIFQSVATFFNTISFGIIPNDAKSRFDRRQKLFKEYSGAFIGVGAYTLYDQGIILGVMLYFLYFMLVGRYKPRDGHVTLNSLLTVFALMQIPLFAIFYSVFDVVLLTLLFLIPINMFIAPKRR